MKSIQNYEICEDKFHIDLLKVVDAFLEICKRKEKIWGKHTNSIDALDLESTIFMTSKISCCIWETTGEVELGNKEEKSKN